MEKVSIKLHWILKKKLYFKLLKYDIKMFLKEKALFQFHF